MNIEKIDKIKRKILPILKRYNAKRAGIFGSVVRGEENQESDIDVLVEIVGRVDLGEYSTIKPIIKEQILSEEVSIL
jgi:predicted nucleotidyltransferase